MNRPHGHAHQHRNLLPTVIVDVAEAEKELLIHIGQLRDKFYQRYGGRGITICSEWMDYAGFREWAFSSGYNPDSECRKCTLDRIDNDGKYCPENCRWVTQKVQDNNRSSNHIVTNSSGISKTLSEWSEITGIRKDTLRRRICVMNWDIDRALTEPVHR